MSSRGKSRVESMAFLIPIIMLHTRLKFSWAGWISLADYKICERGRGLRILFFFISVLGTFYCTIFIIFSSSPPCSWWSKSSNSLNLAKNSSLLYSMKAMIPWIISFPRVIRLRYFSFWARWEYLYFLINSSSIFEPLSATSGVEKKFPDTAVGNLLTLVNPLT